MNRRFSSLLRCRPAWGWFGALVLLLAGLPDAPGAVGVPRVFSNNQVLQRGTNTSVWGWAEPNEAITLDLQGDQAQTQVGTADAQGRWSLRLDTLYADPSAHTLVISGTNSSVTITNLIIGDVWFCSGQSNMDMGMYGVSNSAAELADANYPALRLCKLRPVTTGVAAAVDVEFTALNGGAPQDSWSVSKDSAASTFSALAFIFGRTLHTTSGVPVGLIQASVGATGIDLWTDPLAYDADPRFGVTNGFTDTNYYNGTVGPITPLAIRGVVWYQGEAEGNSFAGGYDYRNKLDLLVQSWRAKFPVGDFPFIAIQLHNWAPIDPTKHWDELRESQSTILFTNHTALVVGVDVGDPLNLHPANKAPLGRRAALAARYLALGETNLLYQGPVWAGQQVVGTNVVLTFTHVGTGLVVRGGGELKGFMLANAASNYLPAQAHIISSNQVVVNHPRLAAPVAVRYGWYFNPQEANLGNSADLPANVFRTDSFGLFSGGPNKLGDLTFRGDLSRTAAEESATFRANLRRTGVYRDRAPSRLTNVVWSFATGSKVRSAVALQDGRVVFAANNTNIYAVSAATGSSLWTFQAGLSSYALALDLTNDVASAPVFAGGVVVVPIKDKYIVLNPEDGTYRYSYEAQPAYQTGDDRLASPAVIDDQILFAGMARLYGLEPRTGYQQVYKALHWNGRSPAFTRCSPAVEGALAYFTEPNFFSINLTNLDVVGLTINNDAMNTNPAPPALAPCAALAGGSAIFARTNLVLSINLQTRTTNWTFVAASPFDAAPAIYRDTVYIGNNDGNLYALGLATGSSNWTFATGGAVKSSPAVANGLIYFGSGDGKVYAVDPSGQLVSSYQTGGPVQGSPVIKAGVVYVGSDDGSVYALSGDDTTPPVLESAAVPTGTVIQLVFNEPLSASSVTPLAHYQLSGGGVVTQASLSADTLTVTLLTQPLVTGLVYTLQVTNVTDVAGNPVAPGLQTNLLYTQVLPTYAVTYQGNGSSGGNTPTDTNVYTAGQTVTVRGNTGHLYRVGFAFSGWNTAANGAGVSYLAGQTLGMPGSNLVLFAAWTSNATPGLIAYEGFDLAEGEDALASSSGGASSTGWTGVWTNTTVDVVGAGLAYGRLAVTGGAARLDSGVGAHRGLVTSFNTGTVWISFLAVVSNATSYAGVSFFNNFNNERIFLGDPGSGTNWAFQSTGLTPAYQSASNTLSTALLVLRIDWSIGVTNNEHVFFWVNPALTEEPSTNATAVVMPEINLNPAGDGEWMSRVRIQQGLGTDNAVLDELRIGRTWADVAPLADDADGDGLPDAWEQAQLGGTAYGPGDDPDGDGASNLEEFIADTHPTNGLSTLELDDLHRRSDGSLLDVAVVGRSNRTYGLWRTTNGVSAASTWEEIVRQGPLPAHTNFLLVETNPPVRGAWYQLRVQLP